MTVDNEQWKGLQDMNALDKYMLFIALFGKTFLIIQIVKIFMDKSADNVSYTAFLLYFVTSLSWILFGLYYRETIVLTSAIAGSVGSLVAMGVIMAFKSNRKYIF